MSYYRKVYLKSEKWQSLRAERLAFAGHKCELCGTSNESLDAHHLKYRRLFDVRKSDLRALCRDCHDAVHFLMKKYKKLKTLDRSRQWSVVKAHLARGIPANKLRSVCEWKVVEPHQYKNMTRGLRLMFARKDFSICRNVLISLRLVKRDRLRWTDDLSSLAIYFYKPILFLHHYITKTKNDPRYRADRIGPHKLLSP